MKIFSTANEGQEGVVKYRSDSISMDEHRI